MPFNRFTSHAFPPLPTYDGIAPCHSTVDWMVLSGGSGAIAVYSHAIVLASAACAIGHHMPGAWMDATDWVYRLWDDERMSLTARMGHSRAAGERSSRMYNRSFISIINRTRRASLQGLFHFHPELLLTRR